MVRSILVALILTSQANAGQLEDLHKGYQLCKETLDSCEGAKLIGDELNTERAEAIKFYKEENEALRKKNDSIFSNPWIYLSIGLITGAVISK